MLLSPLSPLAKRHGLQQFRKCLRAAVTDMPLLCVKQNRCTHRCPYYAGRRLQQETTQVGGHTISGAGSKAEAHGSRAGPTGPGVLPLPHLYVGHVQKGVPEVNRTCNVADGDVSCLPAAAEMSVMLCLAVCYELPYVPGQHLL